MAMLGTGGQMVSLLKLKLSLNRLYFLIVSCVIQGITGGYTYTTSSRGRVGAKAKLMGGYGCLGLWMIMTYDAD